MIWSDGLRTLTPADHVGKCLLCGSHQREAFAEVEHLGVSCRYWHCPECGLVYQSPRMTESQMEDFYTNEYRRLYSGQATPTQGVLRIQAQRAAHLSGIVKANISPRRHLDIGCGSGALLEAMQQVCGSTSEGIELGTAFRQFANEQGLTVHASLDEWKLADLPHPDLVTMSHVLEHVMNPVKYLASVRREVLAPGGYLLVEVPNLYVHSCFEVAHNFAFSTKTLRQVMLKAGFTEHLLKPHGVPVCRSHLYLTFIARALDQPSPIAKTLSRARIEKLKRTAGVGMFKMEKLARRYARRLRNRVLSPRQRNPSQ